MTREEKILAIFNSFDGPVSVEQVAAQCFRENIWSKEERDRFQFEAGCHRVRSALNRADKSGVVNSLIRIEMHEENGVITKVELHVQKEWWTEDDARFWVRRRVEQMRKYHKKIEAFLDECQRRWPATNWWALVPVKWLDDDDVGMAS